MVPYYDQMLSKLFSHLFMDFIDNDDVAFIRCRKRTKTFQMSGRIGYDKWKPCKKEEKKEY